MGAGHGEEWRRGLETGVALFWGTMSVLTSTGVMVALTCALDMGDMCGTSIVPRSCCLNRRATRHLLCLLTLL